MQDLINKIFCDYNIPIQEKTCENMQKLVESMLKYNETHNLTAITEQNDVLYKHILDSVLPYRLFTDSQKVLDIGCGAGFPSVPLAIVNNNLNITAIDSVQKKTDFVKMVKNQLNLENLSVIHTRIEDFARNSEFREGFDIVVSRAVAPLNIILEYSAPMLKNGGYIYAYKGINYEEEIAKASNAFELLDCKVENIDKFYIKEMDTYRYLIRIKKLSSISSKYPRRQNKPRLNPL